MGVSQIATLGHEQLTKPGPSPLNGPNPPWHFQLEEKGSHHSFNIVPHPIWKTALGIQIVPALSVGILLNRKRLFRLVEI
jgi:hypothetical protein